MPPPQRALLRRVWLALLCVAFLAIYCNRVLRVYLAQRSAESSAIVPGLEQAIRLVPDDARFPHLLGLQLSASDQDYEGAVANLRKAVALNPHNGRYWLDLASVYQEAGNVSQQNEALRSAVAAEPGNPEIAAEAAQYYLAGGDTNLALPLIRQALDQNPQVAPTLLLAAWRSTHDAKLLLANAIPPVPELQLALLRLLTEQKEKDAANQVWQSIAVARRPFAPELSLFYFDYLIKEGEAGNFDRAWHDLAGIAPSMKAYLPTENLIVNSSFEQPILNYGFDWRYQAADHVAAGIDDRVAHSGSRSLVLSYDGNAAYDAGWVQFVPVQKNTAYEFGAWIKSEDVTSSSGPRVAIVDAYSGTNLLLTDDVLDTHSWRQLEGSLQTGETELAAVKIIRAPANTKIRGRVWIDDLRLVRK